MAYTTIAEALAAYNANLDWDTSPAKARIALDALRYLKINRAYQQNMGGASLSFESINEEIAKLESFVNGGTPITSSTPRRSFTLARGRF